jgi:hypothetical protein
MAHVDIASYRRSGVPLLSNGVTHGNDFTVIVPLHLEERWSSCTTTGFAFQEEQYSTVLFATRFDVVTGLQMRAVDGAEGTHVQGA